MRKLIPVVLTFCLFLTGCGNVVLPTETPVIATATLPLADTPASTEAPAVTVTSVPEDTATSVPRETEPHIEPTAEPDMEPVIIQDISAFFRGEEAAMDALVPLLEAVSVTAYNRLQGDSNEPIDILQDTFVLECFYHYLGIMGDKLENSTLDGTSVTLPLETAEALVSSMFLGREGLPDIPAEWEGLLAYDSTARTLTAVDYIPTGMTVSLRSTAYDTEVQQLLVTLELRWPEEDNPAAVLIVTLLRGTSSLTGAMVSMVDQG